MLSLPVKDVPNSVGRDFQAGNSSAIRDRAANALGAVAMLDHRLQDVRYFTASSDPALFSTVKLLIVGSCHPAHIGSFFASAARQLGLDYQIMDIAGAEASSRIVRTYYWHFCDKKWARLKQFGAQVLNTCAVTQRNVVLT